MVLIKKSVRANWKLTAIFTFRSPSCMYNSRWVPMNNSESSILADQALVQCSAWAESNLPPTSVKFPGTRHACFVYACSCAVVAELSSYDRDGVACIAPNTLSGPLQKKCVGLSSSRARPGQSG